MSFEPADLFVRAYAQFWHCFPGWGEAISSGKRVRVSIPYGDGELPVSFAFSDWGIAVTFSLFSGVPVSVGVSDYCPFPSEREAGRFCQKVLTIVDIVLSNLDV